MFNKIPFVFKIPERDTYNKAFLLESLSVTTTAMLAVHFNTLSETRMNLNLDCSDDKSLFCNIHNDDTIRKIELVIQTFTTTSIIYFTLFLMFGVGEHQVNDYYIPSYTDIKAIFVSMAIILMTNLLFYGFVIVYKKINTPTVYSLIYGIAQQYGIVTITPDPPSK